MKLEIISEVSEQQLMNYYCLISNRRRYDLMVGYSEHFFGKTMVTSIQTGKMVLLCHEDIYTEDYWAEKLGIDVEDIPDFQQFFKMVLRSGAFPEQYKL